MSEQQDQTNPEGLAAEIERDFPSSETPGNDNDAGHEGGAATGNGEESGPGDTASQKEDKNEATSDEPKWYTRRIARFTAQTREAERQAQAAREETEQLRKALAHARGEEGQEEQPSPHPSQSGQHHPNAGEQEQLVKFNEACNGLAMKLAQSHGEESVAEASRALAERGGMDFSRPDHRELIGDIAALENGPDVYRALSRDPDAASEIFDAPPRRQYALLDRFVQKMGKPGNATAQPVSKAPRPAGDIPTGGSVSGGQGLYDPNLSADAFAKVFEKRMNER